MKQSTYLILENRTRHDWSPEFAVLGCRKTKPALGKQQVAIRLNITLPDKTFDEFIPEAQITVPDEMMLRPAVEVEIGEPEEE